MKWKITARFLFAILCTVLTVVFVNIILLLVFYFNFSNGEDAPTSATDFTYSIAPHIVVVDQMPTLTEEGYDLLKERHAWVQFLDDNGHVISAIRTPSDAPNHYTPFALIQAYKYRDKNQTSTFVAQHDGWTYVVGIVDEGLSKAIFTTNSSSIQLFLTKFVGIIILIDVLIAVLIGFIFSSFLSRPVYKITERIGKLKNRNFTLPEVRSRGIYQSVFHNLDDVALSLQKHEEERQKLEKMRNEWVSNVSHDMKTPLASIQGYAELMQHANSLQEVEDYAAVIEQKSIYMRDLLDDFTLTMRLRQQQLPLQLVEVNVVSFVREIVIDVLNDQTFQHRHVEFETEVETLMRHLDVHLMKRALLNFIYNALVHNEENVTVTLSIKANGTVLIQDNGKGIAAEHLPQIFERYYRGASTEDVRGTGLGLAIARDIIVAHGSTVRIDSAVGVGTTVVIRM